MSRRQRRGLIARKPAITIKTEAEIASMRRAGKILADTLRLMAEAAKPGVTTAELDAIAAREIERHNVVAPFKGHEGFEGYACISVNDAVVHGVPGGTVLQDGDIVGLDFGVSVDGMIADGAITVPVGTVSPQAASLLKATERARDLAIALVKPGIHVGDISAAVEAELRRNNLGIIRELVGHGVGYSLWEPPEVPNYGAAGTGPILKPGMTIAIEPMATVGKADIYIDEADGWTVYTKDGSLAAQFEHTIVVTEDGCEILTQS